MDQQQANQRVEAIKRKGSVLTLVAAPIVYGIGQALQPDIDKSDAAEQLPILIEHQVRGSIAMVLCILGLLLLIPAVLTIMRLLRARGAWLGLVGGSLAVAGVVLFASTLAAVGLAPFDIADVPESERAGVVPALQALIDSGQEGQGSIGAYLGVGFILLPLGLLLLAFGLWRARAVPRWATVVFALGAVGMVAGVDHWIRAADAAVLLVGMGAIGLHSLRREGPAWSDWAAVSEGVQPAHP